MKKKEIEKFLDKNRIEYMNVHSKKVNINGNIQHFYVILNKYGVDIELGVNVQLVDLTNIITINSLFNC